MFNLKTYLLKIQNFSTNCKNFGVIYRYLSHLEFYDQIYFLSTAIWYFWLILTLRYCKLNLVIPPYAMKKDNDIFHQICLHKKSQEILLVLYSIFFLICLMFSAHCFFQNVIHLEWIYCSKRQVIKGKRKK